MAPRFTCHLPSLRGRGLSGDHPDLHVGRLVDDLIAYIDSIGEATGLVGWSAGGMMLAVAAQCSAVRAVLHGSETTPLFAASARHVADHAPNAQTHEVAGAGHASPLTHPEALAKALTDFFSPTQRVA